MRKHLLIILGMLLFQSNLSHGQMMYTPFLQSYCYSTTIQLSIISPPPPNCHYEWWMEDFTNTWGPWGDWGGYLVNLGSSNTIYENSYSFGVVRTYSLYTIDNTTGNVIASDNVVFTSSQSGQNIPYNVISNGCFILQIPDELWFSCPWSMWYKNGIATGYSNPNSGILQDSAWYEFKAKLPCGDTVTTGLIYFPRPSAPSITAQGPTTFCTGDSVTLSANSSVGIDKWYKDGIAIPFSELKTTITVGASGIYTVRNKSGTGGGNNCYLYSNPVNITQDSGAYITGKSQGCNGDSIQLTCTAATTYLWKRNGVSIANSNTQSIWVKQSGSYTVQTTGIICNSSPVKTVTFYQKPSNLSITPGTAQTLCSGSTVTLTVGGNNITSYQWFKNGTSMPGATTATSTFTSTGNYKCEVANSIGCTKTTATVNVQSNPNPTLPQKTVVLQPGNEGIDSYITTDILNSGTNYGNNSTIEVSNWYKHFRTLEYGYLNFDLSSLPDETPIISASLRLFVDTINTTNTNANLPNNLYIRRNTQAWEELTLRWNNSPDSTIFQQTSIPCSTIFSNSYFNANITQMVRHWMSNPIQKFGLLLQLEKHNQTTWIQILSSDYPVAAYRPKLTITYYYADIIPSGILHLCTGNSVTFTTNNGPYTYQWYRNGYPILGATNSSFTAYAAGNYYVRLTSANGCSVKSLSKTVTINGLPQINLTPQSDSILYCSGLPSPTLKVDSLAGYSFQWKLNNTNITGATQSNFSPNLSGWYKVTTTSNCGITNADSIYVNKISNPNAVIGAGGPTTFCLGQSVLLMSNTFPGVSLMWYRGTTYLSNQYQLIATQAGNYYVVQTASNCVDTSNTISVVINCREGDFTSQNMEMDVYPIPASDLLNITLTGTEYFDDIRYELLDLSGKSLLIKDAKGITTELNTAPYSSGIYLIKAFQGNTLLAAKRIIISH